MLALIAGTHLLPDPLGALTGIDPSTWFYVLRGIEGAGLCILVWRLRRRPSRVWKAICAWGLIESLLTSACGVAYMVRPAYPGPYEGLCDAETGLPIYAISVIIAAGLAMLVVLERRDV